MEHLVLGTVVGFLLASRVAELFRSARNERLLRERGGRKAPDGVFPFIVALHALFPVTLVAEVVGFRTRPSQLWPFWLILWIMGEGLRFAAIRALGDHWSTRIYVVPGEPRVRRGPYRFFAHPNYLGVVLELAALPMIFSAWRTALIAGIANILLLTIRVRSEGRALAEAERIV